MQGSSSTSREDEENVALTSKGKKKFKKGPNKDGAKQQDGLKKDLSTVNRFTYHNIGHYARQFPQNKNKKQQHKTTSIEVEAFIARFEREFSLCAMHVDRERASIFTSAYIEIERDYSLLTDHYFSTPPTNTW